MLPAATSHGQTTIDPTDPNIRYTGRWDISDPSAPWSYWMGASIIARFEGTALTATFSGGWSGDVDFFRVIIDDDVASSTKIAAGTTVLAHLLASGLADTQHKVEIVKETDVGYWTFLGFELDDGSSLAALPRRPSRKIAFYGDSNLAGYSLEHEQNNSGQQLRGTYHGLAGITARMFDAEYHNISRSGIDIAGMHDRFDRIDYWEAAPVWNFNDFVPDAVVVNLGANDVGSPQMLIEMDYHMFLDDLRAVYPDAHIMLFNGWGWDYDEPANFIHEVIADHGDPNMSSAIFPWLFEQWHGCEYDHAGMAQVLADHLTATLGWVQQPRDVLSGYGVGGDVANGSFEGAAPFGGYAWRYRNDLGVNRVHSPATAYDGVHFLRLTNGAESHQPIPASDGETFIVSMWMRGASEGDQVDVTMDFRDQDIWTTPLQTETETKTLGTDWELFSMTATAPTGTPNPVFHMRVTFQAAPAATVDIDDVMSVELGGGPVPAASTWGLLGAALLVLLTGIVVVRRGTSGTASS